MDGISPCLRILGLEDLDGNRVGSNSADVVSQYMRDVLHECQKEECFRVLIDERLEGERLNAGDVFEVASEGAMNALGVFQAVAYVDERMGVMADFAETVAINRGMPVKVFRSVVDAERWLVDQVEGSDEQFIFRDHQT